MQTRFEILTFNDFRVSVQGHHTSTHDTLFNQHNKSHSVLLPSHHTLTPAPNTRT